MLRAILISLVFSIPAQAAQAPNYSGPGPYGAGYSTVTVTRQDNTTFTARFFYPALTSGAGATYSRVGAPYPAISFGHGFVQAPSAYQGTLQHLATWGYFVIASESQSSFLPSHAALANDMRVCLDWLSAQNASTTSPWFSAVNVNAFGMSGHSMGAGCSILAAAADPRVKALANMAAAETNPSAVAAIANVSCPVMLLSGSQDGTVPVATNGQLMYAAADAPRQLPVITGGYHCGFVDTPSFGGLGCDTGSIPKATQLAIARRKLTTFFELYLRGNSAVWSDVWGETMRNDTAVVTTFDAGSFLRLPLLRGSGFPGTSVVFVGSIANTSAVSETFTLFAEGVPWPLTLAPPTTAITAAGSSTPFRVTVAIPPGTPSGLAHITVSARRGSDGGTRSYTILGVGVR